MPIRPGDWICSSIFSVRLSYHLLVIKNAMSPMPHLSSALVLGFMCLAGAGLEKMGWCGLATFGLVVRVGGNSHIGLM